MALRICYRPHCRPLVWPPFRVWDSNFAVIVPTPVAACGTADEPTSGLDSRSARKVMDVVAKIAKSGRTVIATIHVGWGLRLEMWQRPPPPPPFLPPPVHTAVMDDGWARLVSESPPPCSPSLLHHLHSNQALRSSSASTNCCC